MNLLLRLQSAAAVVLMFIETLRCLNLTGVAPCTEGVAGSFLTSHMYSLP